MNQTDTETTVDEKAADQTEHSLRPDVVTLFTSCLVSALLLHFILTSAGGNFVLPWLSAAFEKPSKPKPEKKEIIEVEMVQAAIAEPPPPPPPPPTDQPPPPPSPPESVQPLPDLIPPTLATPADVPELKPLPPPRVMAIADTAPARALTNAAPYVATPQVVSTPGPKSDPDPGPRHVSATAAKFYLRSPPEYPYEARKRRIQGTPVVEVVFGVDGRPISVEIVKGVHPMLDKAAREHFIAQGYAPAGQAGRYTIEVEYRLVQR